jgi:hypothetical protein
MRRYPVKAASSSETVFCFSGVSVIPASGWVETSPGPLVRFAVDGRESCYTEVKSLVEFARGLLDWDLARLLSRICFVVNSSPQTLQRHPGEARAVLPGSRWVSGRLARTNSLPHARHCR